MSKTLILGGVKSGKSRYAESLALEQSSSPCLIATANAMDDSMEARIRRHQQDRGQNWIVVEEPIQLGACLPGLDNGEVVVIDCLTLWMTNLLMREDETLLRNELVSFERGIDSFSSKLIIVSNETNMGIVPMGELSRRYCDEIGMLHQRLAAKSDRVELVVAGLPMILKGS